MPHPGRKNYVFQNTLMTSHECGATLSVLRISTAFQGTKRNDNLVAIFNLWCWKNIDTQKRVLSWIGIKVSTQVLKNTRIYGAALSVNFVSFSQLTNDVHERKKYIICTCFRGSFSLKRNKYCSTLKLSIESSLIHLMKYLFAFKQICIHTSF